MSASLRSGSSPAPAPPLNRLPPVKNNQNTQLLYPPPPPPPPRTHSSLYTASNQTPSEGSAMSPAARISRSGTVMYCGVPVFAYKIIWASILPRTDLCHSEDSFTSPSLSLHWSLLNFSPSAPFPWRCYFFPKCPTFALAVRDGESDGAVVINKFVRRHARLVSSPSFFCCCSCCLAPQVGSSPSQDGSSPPSIPSSQPPPSPL